MRLEYWARTQSSLKRLATKIVTLVKSSETSATRGLIQVLNCCSGSSGGEALAAALPEVGGAHVESHPGKASRFVSRRSPLEGDLSTIENTQFCAEAAATVCAGNTVLLTLRGRFLM